MPDLVVELVDMASPDGSKLAIENTILYPPAVFIEGKLFGKGKIDADRMVESIRRLNGDRN